jgi:hypothetical protein
VDFKGQHVLEIRPASGFLTFKMEQDGADVVEFDVAPGLSPDVMPTPGLDLEEVRQQFARDTRSVRAAWWHFHREFGSKSQAIYGDIYDIPKDIGTFDLSVMGAIPNRARQPRHARGRFNGLIPDLGGWCCEPDSDRADFGLAFWSDVGYLPAVCIRCLERRSIGHVIQRKKPPEKATGMAN